MKSLIFALPIVLFTMLGFAADTTAKSKPPRTSVSDRAATHRKADSRAAEDAVDDDGVCYSMRVYMFEAKDGEAPRAKGVKTCVAADPRILRKTDQPSAQFKQLK
jgi:hypothetical protein